MGSAEGLRLMSMAMNARKHLCPFTPDKVWVPQGELEAINPDGSTPELFPATIGAIVEATSITPTEALNLRFSTTYSLEVDELSDGIKRELDAGGILTFPFNPRADYQVETGILVGNENGYFALIGEKVDYEFASLAQIASLTDEATSEESDDLDFEMF